MNPEPETALSIRVSRIPEEGIHHTWAVGPERFTQIAHPIPVSGPVTVEGKLYRVGVAVYFDGSVSAALALECSRCLERYAIPVNVSFSAVFMPHEPGASGGREENQLEAEDLDVQIYSGENIDLFPPLRDQVALAAPMRPLCSEDCKGWCPQCGANLNQAPCACQRTSVDPRFAALEKLKRNQE